MLNFNKNETKLLPRWLLYAVITVFIILAILASSYLIFEKKYENKIYPGITLGGFDMGGKTPNNVKEILNQRINTISQNGTIFLYEDNRAVIMPIVASLETDLAYEIIMFNIDKTVYEAYKIGRDNNFFFNLRNKLKTLVFKNPIKLKTAMNEEKIIETLKKNFSQFEIPAEDAKLVYDSENSGEDNYKFSVYSEKLGKVINYKEGINQLRLNMENLNNNSIKLLSVADYPKIYKKDCLNINQKANKIIDLAPLVLKYDTKEWNIDKNILASWLVLKTNPVNKNSSDDDPINTGLGGKIVKKYLKEEIAVEIDRDPVEAKFEIKNGRVAKFQASKDGVRLDLINSFLKINSSISNMLTQEIIENNEIELVVNDLKSSSQTEEVNDFGIKEIIGIGESDFSGSPANRRHNIKVGADTLNGLLIKPGEEFSLMGALGDIDGSTGYLQELVIKNNQTIPEYGGGLCQIGTTIFRATLASGLPVTARRNHSYRVSYYEPAGTDATIYNPWPDYKFKNDTDNHVLIQARIEGDKLYFDFWGTKDGRNAESTDPIIYNITRPGPTKLIETLDLAPGVKKCTERAHNGADAYFDYTVTYPDGEVKEKRFNSHYVPWREVCLIGVEELSVEKKDNEEEKKVENEDTVE